MKRSEVAVELLNTQLQILMETNEPDEFLVHQARLHLAFALVAEDDVSTTSATQTIHNLEYIVAYCQRLALDSDTHGAASEFCIHSVSVLDAITEAGFRTPRVSQLKNLFIETLERLPPTDLNDALGTIRRVTRQISAGQGSDAEQECRRLLMRDWYGSNIQLEIQRLLIESLIRQHKWASIESEINSFAVKAGQNPLYRYSVDMALHNIGLFLAGYSLDSSGVEPRRLFVHLMSLPCFVEAVNNSQGEYRVKFDVLSLIFATIRRSREEMKSYSARVLDVAFEDMSIAGNQSWSFLTSSALDVARLVLDADSANE